MINSTLCCFSLPQTCKKHSFHCASGSVLRFIQYKIDIPVIHDADLTVTLIC